MIFFRNIRKNNLNSIQFPSFFSKFKRNFKKATTTSLIQYFQYQTNINYQEIIETSSEFPAVTICNLNPIDFTSRNLTGDYIKKTLRRYNINPTINATYLNGYDLVMQASSILKANIIADETITQEDRKNLSFTLDTMLISCYYNDQKCNASDFYYFYSFEYGNCYSFNYENVTRVTSKYGPSSGLTLELFVGVQGKF